jgi:hypothetical protein
VHLPLGYRQIRGKTGLLLIPGFLENKTVEENNEIYHILMIKHHII